jgi:hypothetical protein
MHGSPKRRLDHGEYNLKARYVVFFIVVLGMFVYLAYGLANIQLGSGEEYAQSAENRRTTKITLRGSRGMITDADAVILAKDEMIYNVTFYRDASQNSKTDYASFTQAISDAIDIIEENGNELSVDFVIQHDPDSPDDWQFNFGSGVSEAVLQTRETQWRNNNYFTTTSVPTANDAMTRLKSRYQIPEGMSEEKMLKVMAVYSEMQMNLYNSRPSSLPRTCLRTGHRDRNPLHDPAGAGDCGGHQARLPAQHPCGAGDRLHRGHSFPKQVEGAGGQGLQVQRHHRPGRHRSLHGGLADAG